MANIDIVTLSGERHGLNGSKEMERYVDRRYEKRTKRGGNQRLREGKGQDGKRHQLVRKEPEGN